MSEIIEEYGRVIRTAVECSFLVGILGYLWTLMVKYLVCFSDRLMGG